MQHGISRRGFIGGVASVGLAGSLLGAEPANEGPPLIDLHVHRDKSSLDAILALSEERGVKFGIVEHAGTKENPYPALLSNDEELSAYIASLEGKPVFKGVQAEWTDWASCFSREALSKLDYVLTDAWTFPAPDGHRQRLWESGADLGDLTTFPDRYVDWYVKILSEQPIDIIANVSWFPPPFTDDLDALWTEARAQRVVDAAVKHGVAIEISSQYLLPKKRFLELAKSSGAKFTFGTNGRYPKMGLLDYSVQMAHELGLTRRDMFIPTPGGARAGRASN